MYEKICFLLWLNKSSYLAHSSQKNYSWKNKIGLFERAGTQKDYKTFICPMGIAHGTVQAVKGGTFYQKMEKMTTIFKNI